MFARDLRLASALGVDEGTQPGVQADDVALGQVRREHLVGLLEQVVEVGVGRGRVGEVVVPCRVRGADHPGSSPREHEQHRRRRLGDEGERGVDAIAGDDDVHALARAHAHGLGDPGKLLGEPGPHARRVDNDLGGDIEGRAGGGIEHASSDDAITLARELRHAGAGHQSGPFGCGGASQLERVTRIVDLRVVIADGTRDVVVA